MTHFKISATDNGSVHKLNPFCRVRAVARVDVPEYMKPRLDPLQLVMQVRAPQVNNPRRGNIQDTIWRRVRDEDIDTSWDLSPPLNQLIVVGIVSKSREVWAPGRSIN